MDEMAVSKKIRSSGCILHSLTGNHISVFRQLINSHGIYITWSRILMQRMAQLPMAILFWLLWI